MAVGGLRLRARPLLAIALLVPSVLGLRVGLERHVLSVANVTDSDVAMGRWVAANLPPDARLGVQDIGAMAYFAPQPQVDMAGIVNPEILPYLRGDKVGSHPSGLGGWARFLEEKEVDFLVLFPNSYGGIPAISSVIPDLRPVHRIAIDNNITMAGSELMVLATPWGRASAGLAPAEQ